MNGVYEWFTASQQDATSRCSVFITSMGTELTVIARSARGRSSAVVLASLASVLLTCLMALPSSAAAQEPYGELARFGGAGVGNGRFELREATEAFGVDPEDGGVYVGDEPAEEGKSVKYPVGDYRIQKLGSKGEFLGAAAFKAKCAGGEGKTCIGEEAEVGIEGIVFDTVKNEKGESERRLYVLSTLERRADQKFDSETIAAGALYAFSTKPKEEGGEKKLVPAAGTGPEGVLVGLEAMKGDSKEQAGALLEPKGITVDPTTHEIIIAGEVDEGGEGINQDEGLHLALQRINAKGELGARYVSPVREYGFIEANSPVVTQNGQVLMQVESRILQIPSNFASKTAPKVVYELDENEQIIEFGEQAGFAAGGALAIAPGAGRTGTLWSNASVDPFLGPSANQGVVGLHYESKEGEEEVHVHEFGWLAGKSEASQPVKCVLGFEGVLEEPIVAAAGQDTFVLEPGLGGADPEPRIVEFGPSEDPEGCPVAKASEPVATIEGAKVTKVKEGKEVVLSSTVEGANALSVSWKFGGSEAEQTVSTDENQEAKVEHAFKEPGVHKITETIESDDLSTPTLTETTQIEVTGTGQQEAPVVTKNPESKAVTEGEAVKFEAAASGMPTPTVKWLVSTNGGTSFTEVSGATSDTLTIASTKASESGDEYKAEFSNGVGSPATTSAATLTVNKGVAPVVTKNPANQTVTEGEAAKFEAAASGVPTPTVKWLVSTNGGSSFSEVSGATSDTLTIASTKMSESGDEYKAEFSNGFGSPATTSAATLTVKEPPPVAPVVTKNPASQTVTEGEPAKFEAAASGVPAPTVQWLESTNGGASFSPVSGATSDTLTIGSTKTSESGHEYEAEFTNKVDSVKTSPATLTVNAKPVTKPEEKTEEKKPVEEQKKPGEGEVKGFQVNHDPEAKIATTSITVAASGTLTLKLSCPTGEESCTGTVVLKGILASVAAKKHKPTPVTIATGSFTVAGGQVKAVTLRLSAQARRLLAREHILRATATVSAHDPAGVKRTTTAALTLRLAKPKHKH